MNVGDYVYIYLFDLEKSLEAMDSLRPDRFGRIINCNRMKTSMGNELINQYDIQLLNDKIIKYRTDSLTINMISIIELIEIVGRANLSQEKRDRLLKQISDLLS